MLRCLVVTLVLAVFGAAQAAGPVSTRFVRDPALTKAKEAQIVAAMREQSPQGAAELEKLFAQNVLGKLAPELKRMGLDDQDMADMTAAYWVAAWEASQGIVGRQTDPVVIKGARDQIARLLSADPATAKMSDRDKQDVADTMLLQALLADLRMRSAAQAGSGTQKQMSDMVHAEAAQFLRADLRKMDLTPAGFTPVQAGSAKPPMSAPAVAARPAAHAANWANVEGVYFRSFTGFGVGGMVTSDFEPLVLFRDGTYYEVEGTALEDMDLAASRAAKPAKWGRWSRSGDSFTLTNSKGKASQSKLQGGSFFKAFAADAGGGKLSAKYSRVSGGGDSALGGEMTIAGQTNFSFSSDGSYMRASGGGAIGSGRSTGVATAAYSRKAPQAGRYQIERHTITMTEPDGQVRRQFFAFGSRGTPARPATNMLFIGDRVFVVMD